jgi:phage baseplate assembly protein gpV
VIGFLLAALSTAWTAFAVDIVIESTLDDSNRFVLFGRTVVDTSSTVEVFVCVGLGMTVAAIVTGWLVGSSRRRREVQLRADVDTRWEEISTRNAGMEARNELLEWRYQDLQEQVEVLVARRDELLSHSHRDLQEAKDAVRSTRSRDALRQLQDGTIVLPELDEETGDAQTHDTSTDGSASDNVTRFPA